MSTWLIVDANSIGKAASQGLPFDPSEEERSVTAMLSFVGSQAVKYQATDLVFVFTDPVEEAYTHYNELLLAATKKAGIAVTLLEKDNCLHQLSHFIHTESKKVILLSNDRTWQTLLQGEVSLISPEISKEEGSHVVHLDGARIKETLGYEAESIPEVIALSGILGEAMAKSLMKTYGSISTILLSMEEIRGKSPRTWQRLLEQKGEILAKALKVTPEAGKVDSGVISPLSIDEDTKISPEQLAALTEGTKAEKKLLGEDAIYVDSLQMFHEAAKRFEATFEKGTGFLGITIETTGSALETVCLSTGEDTALFDLGSKDLMKQVKKLLTAAVESGWTLSFWNLKHLLHQCGKIAGRGYDVLLSEQIGDGMKQEADGQLCLFAMEKEDEKENDRGAGELLDWLCSLEEDVFSSEKDSFSVTDRGYFTGEYSKKLSRIFCDVSLLAYLLMPLSTGKDFDIEKVAGVYRKLELKDYKSRFGKKSVREVLEEKREAYVSYAGVRTAMLSELPGDLMSELKEDGQYSLYEEMELPLLFTLYSMEKEGIAMDTAALRRYGEELSEGILKLQEQIYQEVGEEFNINSPKQLGTILFEKLGLPAGKKTKSGYSTAADVLEKLAEDYPVVEHILQYRTFGKLKSTYADGLLDCIASDQRVHTTFQQAVTATGRLSSSDPNLQNIPVRIELGKRIRSVFHAKEGYVFLDADYSQIELRVLAHLSGDQQLIEAYRKDRDIHRATAALVFHVPFEEVTPQQRRAAKAVNFGIVYGISSFGLGQNLDISRQQAQQYIDDYFRAYTRLQEYLDELVAAAKRDHVALTMFGRRRPMPELSSSIYMQRQFGERVAMNAPIQGTAADIIKIAMLHVWQRLRGEGLSSKLLLQVHDELLIETKIEEKEQVKAILDEEMHRAAHLLVPLAIDMEEGNSWYDAH
ncbi:DNA polymerase I [Lachnospiraceae bacterium C10]|nr:DNA polymerase I [Lachnospiraceae bacterium C10]